MGVGKKVLDDVKPYLMMVLLQVGYAGMYIVSVASLKQGMNHFVLVTYRNIVATAVMMPFAIFFERGLRPKITMPIFIKFCGLALLEPVIDQNLYYLGNKYTSASFSSALVNILPAVTFIMAIILRMEKLRFRSRHSQAKVAGTMCTVIGAVLMIMYHGPVVQFPWAKGAHHADPAAAAAAQSSGRWLSGTIMIIASCVAWAGFFVLQSNTLNSYPAPLTLTSIICGMGAVTNAGVTLVAERHDMGVWKVGLDTRLFTVVYSGIVCSGVAFYVQGLVTKTRGPVFVTAFQPLCMLITNFMGSIVLKEETTLGSVIGAAIIVLGLYSLIWGKSSDILDSKPANSAAEKLALPLTSVSTNGNSGNGGANGCNGGRHVCGGQVADDVETPAPVKGAICY
ncbi:WAT1-related protein At1g44800-like [Lolium rigidum]|uniref:WAT1-related protein At1g44800-like n=1 Tax=Lolium rigidum TaxID=89674 RepID=UPI001F5CBB51|nr:WAT1-related protein At1g44800-like [Lolium rigidum]